MATTSLWPIRNTGGRGVKNVLKKLVEYSCERNTSGSAGVLRVRKV